jgi:hypothetical protein
MRVEHDPTADRPAGTTMDDEAALADVDRGELPSGGGDGRTGEGPAADRAETERVEPARRAEEDAWLRAEEAPADEMTVGEPEGGAPAVGVASVPPPGSTPPPASGPMGDTEAEAPEAADREAEAPEAADREAEAPEAAGREAEAPEAADREARAEEREAQAEREPDWPSDADLMTAATTGPGAATEEARREEARREEDAGKAQEAPAAAEARPDRAAPEPEPGAEELAPGEVPVTAVVVLWEAEVVDGYRDRWQQIQLRFIDNPRRAAEQAQGLVGDVCQGLTDALNRHRGELDRWQAAELDDTEELRVSVRRYRDLLDRLLSL